MASAAFKSTTKRTPIGKSSSSESSVHRRSRSLSCFSRRLPEPPENISDDTPAAPRSKFINSSRGSGFPEVSLDDLAVDFFGSTDRGRLASRNSDVSSGEKGSGSQRRGRSVSRQSSKVSEGKGSSGNNYNVGMVNSEINRRRRSVSVVRYQISDSESDPDPRRHSNARRNSKGFANGIDQTVSSNRMAPSQQRQGLRRSLSQKDLKARRKSNAYSIASDDCYESRNSDAIQSVTNVRRSFATQLEQSEQRKKDLLAEIEFEEQRGRELSKIMKELVSDSQNTSVEKPLRSRKRSNDRNRVSKELIDEAEKYFEDFLSNVEDTTDISSLDGERSDATSSLGGIPKAENFQTPPAIIKPLPVEMEGVMLPWLRWDNCNDAASTSSYKRELIATSKSNLHGTIKDATPTQNSASSCGSSNPRSYVVEQGIGKSKGSYYTQQKPNRVERSSRFDMEEYSRLPHEEELLLERWRQHQKAQSGCFLLCG